MGEKAVGPFKIHVSAPYPCWITLKDDKGTKIRFSHDELRDLEYAVQSAIREAKRLLKSEGHEV